MANSEFQPNHPLAWMRDKQTTRTVTDLLQQEVAILKPLAQSVKCLESSASTPADVGLFWLAFQAALKDIFMDSDKRSEPMLTEDTISDIRGIVNSRFDEMLQGPDRRVYLSTLFLDPREYFDRR